MGGGEEYPSAVTVQEVVEDGQKAEAQGSLIEATQRYREASELYLTMAKSRALSEDERFALELQSRDLIVRAQTLEKTNTPTPVVQAEYVQSPSVDRMGYAQPISEGLQGNEQTTTSNGQGSASSGANSSTPRTTEQAGAALVGGVTGFAVGSLLGAPVFGMIAGGAFGGVTAQMDNEYGCRAREYGRYGASAVDETKRLDSKYNISGNAKVAAESAAYKAQEINSKYNVTRNLEKAAKNTYERAKEINEKHDLTGKAKKAAESTVKAANEFNEKHKVTDKVASAVSSGFQALNKALSKPEST